MLSVLNAKCNASNLKLGTTTVEEVEYDQGKFDYYYTANFTGTYLFDGAHPVTVSIQIVGITDSTETFTDIQSIKADANGVCS